MGGKRWVAASLGGALALTCFTASAAPVLADCDGPFASPLHAAPATDARAYWLNRQLIKWPGADASRGVFKLYYSANALLRAVPGARVTGADGVVTLSRFDGDVPASTAQRFKFTADGIVFNVADAARLMTQQVLLVQEADDGSVRDATSLQIAGALDDLYADAAKTEDFGATVTARGARFKLWAPTAQSVAVCSYASGTSKASSITTMQRDDATGIWSANAQGPYYQYVVDVMTPTAGIVRNLVTDPYSVSLTTDSKRSYVANLNAAKLKPAGWDNTPSPNKVAAQTDMTVYELHVRDFSINDSTVSAANRGKYLAFTEAKSNGMKHLAALSKAGMTDIHLLPVYDIGSVPEQGCVAPQISAAAPDSEAPQAIVEKNKAQDCFNWGYDPFHYNAPEGSYSTDPSDGAKRIVEFRQMVQALHKTGLRVGMDVVYNHTFIAGQNEKSVLDRVVPGYYHRLNAKGEIERSTCCDNTATENLMMGKLMVDSVDFWAKNYKIDSFRFDLMGHQPRAIMEQVQARANKAAGRHGGGRPINLIGEGWNFGEVADGARFVQASQLSLGGSGIGSFSDRGRDAVRGGGAGDSGKQLFTQQGYINGLVYDANEQAGQHTAAELLHASDMVKVGLAGT